MRPTSSPAATDVRTRRSVAPRGFTTVELLVALTLTAVMLAAVSGTMGLVARQQKQLLKLQAAPPWARQLSHRLRWDLENARTVALTRDVLHVAGCGSRSALTGVPTHRPLDVWYRREVIAGRPWLWREERPLGASRLKRELMAVDIGTFRWCSYADGQWTDEFIGDVPQALQLQLFQAESTTDALVQVIVCP